MGERCQGGVCARGLPVCGCGRAGASCVQRRECVVGAWPWSEFRFDVAALCYFVFRTEVEVAYFYYFIQHNGKPTANGIYLSDKYLSAVCHLIESTYIYIYIKFKIVSPDNSLVAARSLTLYCVCASPSPQDRIFQITRNRNGGFVCIVSTSHNNNKHNTISVL